MATMPPRIVYVVRETDFELLLARHATRQQARFFLDSRGQDIADLEVDHERFREALQVAARLRSRKLAADRRQTRRA